jgi:hypothetical protein
MTQEAPITIVRQRAAAINQLLVRRRSQQALEEAYALYQYIDSQPQQDADMQTERRALEEAIARLEEAVRIRMANQRFATKAWLTRIGFGVLVIGIVLTVFLDLHEAHRATQAVNQAAVDMGIIGERITSVMISLAVALGGLVAYLVGLTMDADPRFTMGVPPR